MSQESGECVVITHSWGRCEGELSVLSLGWGWVSILVKGINVWWEKWMRTDLKKTWYFQICSVRHHRLLPPTWNRVLSPDLISDTNFPHWVSEFTHFRHFYSFLFWNLRLHIMMNKLFFSSETETLDDPVTSWQISSGTLLITSLQYDSDNLIVSTFSSLAGLVPRYLLT